MDFFKHLDHSLAPVSPSGSWENILSREDKNSQSCAGAAATCMGVPPDRQGGRLSGEQLGYKESSVLSWSFSALQKSLRWVKLSLLCKYEAKNKK